MSGAARAARRKSPGAGRSAPLRASGRGTAGQREPRSGHLQPAPGFGDRESTLGNPAKQSADAPAVENADPVEDEVAKREQLERIRQSNCTLDRASVLWLPILDGPGGGGEFRKFADAGVGEAGENGGQVVADWELHPAAAFHHRENGGHLRAGLRAAYVQPIFSFMCMCA